MRIIYPVTRDERERLKIPEQEFGGVGTLGLIFTPSDIRRGIKRWLKQGRPNVYAGEEVSEGVNALHAELSAAHKANVKAVEQTLLDEFEVQVSNLTTANTLDAENREKEVERHRKTYERRINLKNEHLLEFKNELKAEREKVQTYASHFGEIRSHPLNRFQRFVLRLFRIT